jgi:hypothetical protein
VTEPAALEPYTASIRFTAPPEIPSPSGLVAALLEDIARRCGEAGCSVIGHIKCHARAGERAFSCSLATRRSGAACRGAGQEPVTSGEVLEVDLAVLVYGLPRATIETIVIECLAVSAPGAKVNPPGECGVVNHDHVH